MKKIAILGATGYIGKSLAHEFSLRPEFEVFLFGRSTKKINRFLKEMGVERKPKVLLFNKFNNYEYDVVINCTGIGNPSILKKDPSEIFKVTEMFDTLVLGYIKNKPGVLYINLSSGAVYGKNANRPIEEATETLLPAKSSVKEFYSIAKINSEAKHRALPEARIVDLRIFSFFSQFVDISAGFLMSGIVDCLRQKKTFVTTRENIIRDYIGQRDLFSLIIQVIKKGKVNDFFDVYSLKPVKKLDLLKRLKKSFGLKYEFIENSISSGPTGSKNAYYSKNKKARQLAYTPKFTSLQLIEEEIRQIL